eukprot:CAMPEP_0194137600 /NCGR_PEP_ID=MMETSP0152-20130528/7482_1 /TAXON_ID=1049557 /ORGANISM="Thalassiothrix antarctica, Strain L6-D1" /LENGTH=399 /DNA_ID=CAMNT_0038834699 /DNA_START=360 /DNA_END=1559 /DNA_ORIENTATION=+
MALSTSEGREDLLQSSSMDNNIQNDTANNNKEEVVDDETITTTVNPKLITFDGDQTLYSDGSNFESNPRLANYLYLLLKHGVTVAVVTAAGYEYNTEKYEYRLSGLLAYFAEHQLSSEDCSRFYLFGGECNYLLCLGSDYKLHPVKEIGPGGWKTSTKYIPEAPGNWNEEAITKLLNVAERNITNTVEELKMRGRVIRKKHSVGLVPTTQTQLTREALDEAVLRVQDALDHYHNTQSSTTMTVTTENTNATASAARLPFCAFNGGRDVWVDVGNKRVGVEILQSYTGIGKNETLHIGDQFLNTGNDFAARDVCPCVWITDPEETTYILKSILRLAEITDIDDDNDEDDDEEKRTNHKMNPTTPNGSTVNFSECERRTEVIKKMDVFTGEMFYQAPNIQS